MAENDKKIEELKEVAKKQSDPKIKQIIEDKLKHITKPLNK